MKQRKISSVIGVLISLAITVVFAAGCGKVPSKFIGSYTGSWKASDLDLDGTWTGSIDHEGIITMEFKGDDITTITVKGTVDKNGDISASGSNKTVTLTLTGKLKDKKISGTAKLKAKGSNVSADGTFEGKKQS